MNFGELRSYLRMKLQDEVEDYLWPDEEMNEAINQALREAAVRDRLIKDRTSAICSFPTVVDDSEYQISRLFFRITRATIDGSYLRETTRDDVLCHSNGDLPTGKANRYYIDDDGSFCLDKKADAVYTVKFEGYRYPMPLVDDTDEVEDAMQDKQIQALSWAMKLLKEKEDPETERQGDAARHEADFARVFGPQIGINAIRKQFQYSRKTIRYGGL